jgi:hypothetical protein
VASEVLKITYSHADGTCTKAAYPAGQVMVVEAKDAVNNRTEVFTNVLGQTIMVRPIFRTSR